MGNYNLVQIVALFGALIQAGVATEQRIVEAIRAHAGHALSEDELNAIVDGIMADAAVRKARADQAVEQAKADGAV